jgi:hypothetical protein
VSTERPCDEFSGFWRHLRGYTRATRPTHDTDPTIIAVLDDGPLSGREVDAAVVEGRPPKTIDVPGEDGTTCRYCLAEWNQSGPSATYEFLYLV